MSQGQNAQTVALQLEKVRDKIPLLYERDDILLTMIQQRGDVEKVSSRNMRLPLEIRPGGKAGLVNMDGGDLGRGSATTYDVAQVTPIFFRNACEITKLVEYATNQSEKAIENAAKREVKNQMAQFRTFLDMLLQTAGNGVIGTVSAIAGTTITASIPFGVALMYYNLPIQFYDPTLTNNRNVIAGTGDSNITNTPNTNTNTFTVDQVPAGTLVGDAIVHSGLAGASPTSIFGLRYHQNNATTGIWLNLNRVTYATELQTPSVNCQSSTMTLSQIRTAFNLIRKALGAKMTTAKLVAHTYIGQQQAYESLAITVSSIIKEGAGGRARSFDGLFDLDQLSMDGVKLKATIHADQTKVDYLDLSHWGRAVMQDVDYYDVDSNIMFPIYGQSGGIAAAYIFYFITGFQIWSDSPRSGSYLYNLSVPSGI